MGFRNPILTATDPTARAAAAAASSTAGDALTLAGNKNHVFLSATAPAAPSYGFTVDDLWIDTAHGNRVNTWTGSAWAVQQYGTAAIAAGAITADQIAVGAITAGKLDADAINGRTITGGTFTTAPATTSQIPAAGAILAESQDEQGFPYGALSFTDGYAADTASYIMGKADYNPRSVAVTLGGGITLQAGRYNNTQGPSLSVKVETDGAGAVRPVARISAPFEPVSSAPAPYIAPPFINNPNPGQEQLTVYQLASGLFFLSGFLYNNSAGAVSAAGTQLASVPPGYQPATGVIYLHAHFATTSAGSIPCYLQSNGGIYLAAGSIPSAAYLVFHCPYRIDVPKHA